MPKFVKQVISVGLEILLTRLAGGYVCSQGSTTFSSDTSQYTSISFGGDDATVTVPLGFTFNFYGVDYTDVSANANGFLSFPGGQTFGTAGRNPQNIPNAGSPNAFIAAFWLNWELIQYGGYRTMGTAPNRVFVYQQRGWVEWQEQQTDFEVYLYETTNAIEITFGVMGNIPSPVNVTAGLENTDGSNGNLVFLFGRPKNDPFRSITVSTAGITYLCTILDLPPNPALWAILILLDWTEESLISMELLGISML